MKKKLLCIAISCILVTAMSTAAFADSITAEQRGNNIAINVDNVDYEYLSDGSYYETVIMESEPESMASVSGIARLATAASSTKTGVKTVSYNDSSGNTLWYVKVTGTFTYNGSTSSCTGSTVTANSNSAWVISSKSASKSGNTATAKATAKLSYSNTTQTVSKTVNLSCDKNGNLS